MKGTMTLRRRGDGFVKCAALGAPVVLVYLASGLVAASHAGTPAAAMALSPSVVMLAGKSGQSHRQTLQLTNYTSRTLTFELDARDVVVVGDRRDFLAAGERPDSIAATAVFSAEEIVVAPGSIGAVDVTLTVPDETRVRAVAAIFRGRTALGKRDGVTMTASLGCLITFTLSDDIRVETTEPVVMQQTATRNLTLAQWVTNIGSEPVVPTGVIAVVNTTGALVGKVPVEPQRLLPGERLKFGGDYPGILPAGGYRAVVSLQYGDKVQTSTVAFEVGAAASNGGIAARVPGGQQ